MNETTDTTFKKARDELSIGGRCFQFAEVRKDGSKAVEKGPEKNTRILA
jgi:hypothetical protein